MRLNRGGGSSSRTCSRSRPCSHTLPSRFTAALKCGPSDGCRHTTHLLNQSGTRSSDVADVVIATPAALVREPAPDIVHARTANSGRLFIVLIVAMARVASIRTPAPHTSTNVDRNAQLGHILIHIHRTGSIRVRPRPGSCFQSPSRPRTDSRTRAIVNVRARPIQETVFDG